MSSNILTGFTRSLLLLVSLVVACRQEPTSPSPTPPSVAEVAVNANPNNVVSAIVRTRTEGAVVAYAEYSIDAVTWERSPAVSIAGDTAQIPVLGLLADTPYFIRCAAVGAGDTTLSVPTTFRTGLLPGDLPAFSLISSSDPTPGYVMFGMTAAAASEKLYAVIVDNQGRVRWYRKFPTNIVDFQKQSNGRYTVFSAVNGEVGRFFEVDNLANIIGEFRAEKGSETGVHELRVTADGHALFGVERRTIDLTRLGGRADAVVRGLTVEYHRQGRPTLFWNTFDHMNVEDAASDIDLTGAEVNPWHGNAIEIDTDGNLLVSLRNSDQVVKVDSRDGNVIWRLGGKRNEFTFRNDALNGFSHQHGIRRLANGNIILFDNGNLHTPSESRAVEYRLDEAARRAELVWEYRAAPPIYGFAMGFAQRLFNGSTLVSYGTAQRVIEVDQGGSKRWELSIDEPGHLPYRAFRISSLY